MNTELSADHGTIRSKKDKLVTDLKGVVVDADELLKQVANSSAEEFVAARGRIEARLNETISSLREARVNAAEKAYRTAEASFDYATHNPWKIIGVVAATLAAAIMVSQCSSRCQSNRDKRTG